MEFTSWIISARKICTASYLLGVNSERIPQTPLSHHQSSQVAVCVLVCVCMCQVRCRSHASVLLLQLWALMFCGIVPSSIPMFSCRNDKSCWKKESPKGRRRKIWKIKRKKKGRKEKYNSNAPNNTHIYILKSTTTYKHVFNCCHIWI